MPTRMKRSLFQEVAEGSRKRSGMLEGFGRVWGG
jgi:hypothetical protein